MKRRIIELSHGYDDTAPLLSTGRKARINASVEYEDRLRRTQANPT